MSNPVLPVLTCLAATSLAVSPALSQSLLPTQGQILLQPGSTALGLAPGEAIAAVALPLDTPVMSREGSILVRGQIAPAGTLDGRALFLGRTSGDVQVVFRANSVDPSGTYPNSVVVQNSTTTGLPIGSGIFAQYRISPRNGYLLFGGQLYDGANPGLDGLIHAPSAGITDGVLYWGANWDGVGAGTLLLLAQQNVTTMPGGAVLATAFGGANILPQQVTSLNSAGTAIFRSILAGGDVVGTTNDSAWIIGTPGALSYFLREGEAIAAAGGATIDNIVVANGTSTTTFNCATNEAGQVLHDETLLVGSGAPPVTAADDKVLLVYNAGVHNLLMREGGVAPDATGAPMAGVLFGAPTISQGFGPTGQAAFHCTLTGAVTTATDDALFATSAGVLMLIARAGDTIPGTGGCVINVINTTSNFSESHGAVFGVTMTGPGVTTLNDSALLIAKPGAALTLLAREGDPCPGIAGAAYGSNLGAQNFGSSSLHRINDRGQVLFGLRVNNAPSPAADYGQAFVSWTAEQGARLQMLGDSVNGVVWGGGTVSASSPTMVSQPCGDGSSLSFHEDGDFVIRAQTVTPSGAFVARGRVGSLQASPSTAPATGGVTQNLAIDLGPAHAGELYIVLATSSGTEPGTLSPIGPQVIPLNWDPFTQLSFDYPNSTAWVNSLGFLDGQGTANAAFVLPPGLFYLQGLLLHHAATTIDLATFTTTGVTEPGSLLLN